METSTSSIRAGHCRSTASSPRKQLPQPMICYSHLVCPQECPDVLRRCSPRVHRVPEQKPNEQLRLVLPRIFHRMLPPLPPFEGHDAAPAPDAAPSRINSDCASLAPAHPTRGQSDRPPTAQDNLGREPSSGVRQPAPRLFDRRMPYAAWRCETTC